MGWVRETRGCVAEGSLNFRSTHCLPLGALGNFHIPERRGMHPDLQGERGPCAGHWLPCHPAPAMTKTTSGAGEPGMSV